MPLTDRQLKAREGKLTASDVSCLMEGDAEGIYRLWLKLTGDPSWTPEDFTKNWPVLLGTCTEQLHLDWLQYTWGPVVARGKVFAHPDIAWAASTLDGWLEDHDAPVEAKHNNGFEDLSVVVNRYMPQMHWQMFCTGTEQICFSVIRGAREPQQLWIPRDMPYLDELVSRATEFMKHVRNLTEPVPNPFVEPPKVEATKVVSMLDVAEFGDAAAGWLANQGFARQFERDAKTIKKLVPADAKEAYGYGIRVKRSASGALTIKEEPRND